MLAGCGAAAQPARHASRPAAGPCVEPARAAVARAAGAAAASTRVTAVSPGQATCVYEAAELRVSAQVDTNPQAAFRFDRAVVERSQNAVWGSNRRKWPQQIFGIGQGADWFPADRELLATDGRKLVSVSVARSGMGERPALRLSRAVAKLTLARGRA